MNYDAISNGYEELHGQEQLNKGRIILDNLNLKKDDWLLDIGCGPGQLLEMCDCQCIGIDPSFKLLAQSKKHVIQARAEQLPFKDNSFDYVVSITAIHNFDNIDKAIQEIKRVAKQHVAISLLKNTARFEEIEDKLKENFKIHKIILENKDAIFFLKKI